MVHGGWACENHESADGIFIGYNEDRLVVVGNVYQHPQFLIT